MSAILDAIQEKRFLGWILLAWIVSACNGNSLAGTDEAVPTYGACNLQPNYISEVRLNRWRSFPLAYFLDSASFSPDLVTVYHEAITTGIRRWEETIGNGLGAVVETDVRDAAQFVITFRAITPSDAAARTFHSTGAPFLAGGEIAFNRSYLTGIEEEIRDGTLRMEVFSRGVAGVAAHEMGHLLGIIGHSTRDDVLMGESFHDAPTIADVNTLIHAYCR